MRLRLVERESRASSQRWAQGIWARSGPQARKGSSSFHLLSVVRFSRAPQLRQPPESHFFFFFCFPHFFDVFIFYAAPCSLLLLICFIFFVVSVRVDAEPKPKERPHYRGVNPVAASPLECLAFFFQKNKMQCIISSLSCEKTKEDAVDYVSRMKKRGLGQGCFYSVRCTQFYS